MMHSILPSPAQLRARYPLSHEEIHFIANSRHQAQEIISGTSPRKAVILGPCSIHERKSALEYALRVKKLSLSVREECFLVMRVYIEKPRTITGWKGLLYDPHLDESHDIETGLLWARELLVELAKMGVPTAMEFVDPLAAAYFSDLITWGFIGSRTSASQPHRQLASSLPFPVGFKNSTDGSFNDAIHGILSAQTSHALMQIHELGSLASYISPGNKACHLVLRGSNRGPNYDPASVESALIALSYANLPMKVMIDCSHGNSQKQHLNQCTAFASVLEQMTSGTDQIMGIMLESHLESGNQPFSADPQSLQYAVSITDPCIDWKTTEALVGSLSLSGSSSI